MLIALLIAGIIFFLAGLLEIAVGIPVKEFSFGNTVILAGVMTSCSGMILLGLWVAVRELKRAMQALGRDAGTGLGSGIGVAAPRAVFPLPAAHPAPDDPATGHDDLLFNQPGAIRPNDDTESAAPPPWHEETGSRDRARNEMAPRTLSPPVEPAPRQRRNLLFSSTSRKERERAEVRTVDPGLSDQRPAPVTSPLPSRPSEAPPATFEDAWPQSGRPRSVDVSRRSGRAPSPSTEAGAGVVDRPPAERTEEPAQVTVLKSGVVDGMAYSLYSDGSIEAQMPEGMMRFASIDDLRNHLDQRA